MVKRNKVRQISESEIGIFDMMLARELSFNVFFVFNSCDFFFCGLDCENKTTEFDDVCVCFCLWVSE